MSLYALGHACTHRRISDVRRYQHSAEGVSDHLSYNAYYAANPGQTNQHTQGIVRAESGYYCRDPLRFSLWDSIGSTLIPNTAKASGLLPLRGPLGCLNGLTGRVGTRLPAKKVSVGLLTLFGVPFLDHGFSVNPSHGFSVDNGISVSDMPGESAESRKSRAFPGLWRVDWAAAYFARTISTVAILAQGTPRGDAPRAALFGTRAGSTPPAGDIRPAAKASSTRRASQAVPHPSTSRAFHRLASGFG